MEYVLSNTDIFDPELSEKFATIVMIERHQFEVQKVYKFTASFHVDLIKELSSFNRFVLPAADQTINKRKKKDDKDKMYDVLSFQLKQLETVLIKNNIEFYSSSIQGEQLKSVTIIKLEIVEDLSKPKVNSKGKKQHRGKVSSVIPSLPYSQNLIAELSSKRLNELYDKVFNAIRNKRILSEILGIDETENDNLLFQAFVREYGDLWLTTTVREKELFDKLIKRTTEVLEKHNETLAN